MNNKHNIYWVGPRESDTFYCNKIYKASLTIFGDKNSKNNYSFYKQTNERINYNRENLKLGEFFYKELHRIIKNDKHAKFMFYNPSHAFNYGEEIIKRTLCLNDFSLLSFLKNKIQLRMVFSKHIPTLESKLFLGGECLIDNLRTFFPSSSSFVIQKNISSGGFGTLLLTKENETILKSRIENNQTYLVSPFISSSIPINVHVNITEEKIILFPSSIQLIVETDNMLLYKGGDFISFNEIENDKKKKINQYAYIVASILKKQGYIGILGIDFLVTKDNVFFLEVNSRFQSSTVSLNRSLSEKGLLSVNEINLLSFSEATIDEAEYENISVGYSSFNFQYNKELFETSIYLLRVLHNDKDVDTVDKDGFEIDSSFEDNSHLFRVQFTTNISSLNSDCQVNIPDSLQGFDSNSLSIFELKTRLINQGLALSNDDLKTLDANKKFKKGVFEALDITLSNGLIVNSPRSIKFTALSPFNLVKGDGKLLLNCYNKTIDYVKVESEDSLKNKLTKNNVPFYYIANLITDRLRINHQNICYFKKNNIGCSFCNLPKTRDNFLIDDIKEVLDSYIFYGENLNHFLIGGGSAKPETGWEKIIEISSYIRSKTKKQIYLMCLPPQDISILKDLKNAGITEIGFNIEVFDRTISKEIMPGKGIIPIEQYYNAMSESVKLWGNKGNVRSLIIIGLERTERLLNGIQEICQLGVSPILSIIRPLPGTDYQNFIPPNFIYLENTFKRIFKITQEYGLSPGPSCVSCQNNTLSIPYQFLSLVN